MPGIEETLGKKEVDHIWPDGSATHYRAIKRRDKDDDIGIYIVLSSDNERPILLKEESWPKIREMVDALFSGEGGVG